MKRRGRWAVMLSAVLALLMGWLIVRETAQSALAPQQGGKYVALTFDDGPRAETTEVLLRGLQERGARATFFVLGSLAEWNGELLQRMAAQGHQIGQHTYSHVVLAQQTASSVQRELRQTETLLEELLGEGDYWLRPPYGLIEPEQYALCSTPLITWSVDTEDWKSRDCDTIVQRTLSCVQSGDIILMHDIYDTSVQAALEIVDRLQRQGYEFVTVRELMELYGVTPAAGELYRSPEKPGRGY